MLPVMSQERTVIQNRRQTRSTPTRMVRVNGDDEDKAADPAESAGEGGGWERRLQLLSSCTELFWTRQCHSQAYTKRDGNLYTDAHTTPSVHSRSGNEANIC